MADDLSRPLGQRRNGRNWRRIAVKIPVSIVIAGALALFLGLFLVWAVAGDDPLGGEPAAVVAVPAPSQPTTAKAAGAVPARQASAAGPRRHDGLAMAPGPAGQRAAATPENATTVNIINGMTGQRQVVTIPASGHDADSADDAPGGRKFLEMTPQGAIPKIAANGVRPADAFARPIKPLPGEADAPRVAIIVTGLGVGAKETAAATGKLPGAATLAFVPYGSDGALVARARRDGHEVLLEVPMEPFDYPHNDSGPKTLLTSLTPRQNLRRLHWLMSRFHGYGSST